MPNKVIARIRGGLGNQLFCYAGARRLALLNNAELVIDDVTGFVRDVQYCRQYALDHFSIPCRRATHWERMEPFERGRRCVAKFLSRAKPFFKRNYLEEEGVGFDHRLLDYKVRGTLYLDGIWSSENYFKDVENTIRQDLHIAPPQDLVNQGIAERVGSCNSVCVHVRWFEDIVKKNKSVNLPRTYYLAAIKEMMDKIQNPHFFIFSDKPDEARQVLGLPDSLVTMVNNNHGDTNAYADLWLMTQCKHFVIANSTFSWWGAWLSANPYKTVIAPRIGFGIGSVAAIPSEWMKI